MQDAQSGIEMGRYAPQEMTTIRITLRLPKETDNAYSIREGCRCRAHCTDDTGKRSYRRSNTADTAHISTLASISFLIIIIRRRRKDHEEAR
ncbi:MAG: hypothetical protein ACLR84_06015 [Clostridia bacterium]